MVGIRSVVIEYPYVDRDYRSTYYSFYAKKHYGYDRFCVRLHFFRGIIQDELDLCGGQELYDGFMVLRPTKVNPIGVTYVSPRSIDTASGSFICNANFMPMLMGSTSVWNPFPSYLKTLM